MLSFTFDFATLPSFLAFERTMQFVDRLGIDLELLPMARDVRPVPAEKAEETVSERHFRVRAEYEAFDQRRYAAWLGVNLAREPASIDTQGAIDAMLLANRHGRGRSFATDTLRAYWANEITLDEPTIAARLKAVDVPVATADIEDLRAANEARIDELGLFATPGYHVQGQVFLGRQHLPMIERMLAGAGAFD